MCLDWQPAVWSALPHCNLELCYIIVGAEEARGTADAAEAKAEGAYQVSELPGLLAGMGGRRKIGQRFGPEVACPIELRKFKRSQCLS